MSNSTAIAPFRLVGQLESFVMKDGDKVKYLRVSVTPREFWVKIPKQLRQDLSPHLTPGVWVEVQGTRETKGKMGEFKLKANRIQQLTQPESPYVIILPENTDKKRILVCQKSSCWKRGGETLCQQLETKLCDRGLGDQVEIKLTGCLKQCKNGPNVVVLPDKARYSQVHPRQVDKLLEKHFK